MVKTLSMTCPHCNHIAELFLSTNACVIVLNCPSCFSPLMYFENKIFLLSKKQVDAIKGITQNTNVLKVLDRIAHAEQVTENTTVPEPCKKTINFNSSSDSWCNELHRQRDISQDDITNLRIELALCNDVQDFIDSL